MTGDPSEPPLRMLARNRSMSLPRRLQVRTGAERTVAGTRQDDAPNVTIGMSELHGCADPVRGGGVDRISGFGSIDLDHQHRPDAPHQNNIRRFVTGAGAIASHSLISRSGLA